ncbi:MAG: glycosyltransferase [Gammaproteobacteria bacterium]|nr:glycosyltransferase [Gammaproteobacteria bacterium]
MAIRTAERSNMNATNLSPLVSVCMISYKHEKYIARAIESILSQELEFPIELVIGDDCSPDSTFEICSAYASRDSRIKLLPSSRNLGVMKNFSRTLNACTGKYVAVCEGDDYWTDMRKLSKQVEFLDNNPEFGGAAHQSNVLIHEKVARVFREGVPDAIRTDHLLGGRLYHTASILFRRPAVELFVNSPLVLSCDRLLNFCVSFLGPIHFNKDIMCVYRLHGGGMSSNATISQMKLDLNCVEYLKSLCPDFPKYRYLSYVYATIGLCKQASNTQKLGYLALSFLYSFSNFPRNIHFFSIHLFRALNIKLTGRCGAHR